ncbi:MAG TPA: amidase, partial [Tepidiformaceae bacterium]|nr:amidase [Tepidiformaceae bacterium]
MLRQSKALNPTLGAFITITEESAMAEATAADQKFASGIDLGPLQGIPYCVKDNIATKDAPTTANSHVLDREWGAGWDAPVVARLRAAGAVHMGKTVLSEFAFGLPDATLGWQVPKNPWNTDYSPAGSSNGTGIAVSAGMVYCGLGTDTGGSIRQPGSANGHTSIKATFGRVPKSGCAPLGYSLDNIGPHARSAWDCAAMLTVISGYDSTDLCAAKEPVPDFTAAIDGSVAGMRIGIPSNFFFEVCTPEIADAVMNAVDVLKDAGATIVPVYLPHAELAQVAGLITLECEALAYHLPDLQTRRFDYGYFCRTGLMRAALYTGSDFVQAQRFRSYWKKAVETATAGVDVLITPTSAAPPPLIADMHPDSIVVSPTLTFPWNVNGWPAMAVPIGFSAEKHLPLSMQVVGKAFDEAAIFKVADAYQQLTNWHLQVPPIAAEVLA